MNGRNFMVAIGPVTKFHRQTMIQSRSAEWYQRRGDKTIGSSQAASVFNGVSKTETKQDFINSLKGIRKPEPSAFVQQMMDVGKAMEPTLQAEAHYVLELLLRRKLISYVPCQFAGDTHYGVEERSTPDLIVVDTNLSSVALVELKWRTTDDCGWQHPLVKGSPNRHLGLTVWCQVQHQMHVTGIHSAFVYSGCAKNRRLWHVNYCSIFRQKHFLPALERCALKDGADDFAPMVHISALSLLLDASSQEIGLPIAYSMPKQ